MSASSSCECRPDRHTTVCIRLAPQSSHKLARLVVHSSLTSPVQSKEEGGRLCRQAARASAGQMCKHEFASASHRKAPTQACSNSRSHRKAATQACSIGRRSLTAPVQSKEEGGSLCRQAARASASQTGKTVCIRASHRRTAARLARLVGDP